MDTVLLFVKLSLHTIKATRSIDARINQLLNCTYDKWLDLYILYLVGSVLGWISHHLGSKFNEDLTQSLALLEMRFSL